MASDVGVRLREQVAARAKFCCEYCLIHEDAAAFPHQVDHIISRKHDGKSLFENLAYACMLCNRHKGSDVAAIDPATEEVVRLYHPRSDQWADHFSQTWAIIQPLTKIGRATIRLLKLNTPERVMERAILGSSDIPAF